MVRGRMKARAELALMTGWHAENFARAQRLKHLSEYLKTSSESDPDTGAMALRGMIARMAEKQTRRKDAKHGDR